MLQATQDIRKVALWLGHADIRTTEIYLRVDPSEKLEAVEAVSAAGLASRTIQGAGRANRFTLRAGIMQSPTSLKCRPQRHSDAVALHNRALRIIRLLRFSAIG